jgi:hypothetical protein
MICSLPYDVQLAISRALPVRDILILKAVSILALVDPFPLADHDIYIARPVRNFTKH